MESGFQGTGTAPITIGHRGGFALWRRFYVDCGGFGRKVLLKGWLLVIEPYQSPFSVRGVCGRGM